MIRFNLRLALRSLLKNSKFTIINTLGLAIGLAAFILLALFIYYHLTFDKKITKIDRIYRVDQVIQNGGQVEANSCAPFPLRNILTNNYPEIEKATRTQFCREFLSFDKEHTFMEQNGLYVEHDFLEIFDFELIKGDATTALLEMQSIVLSEELAKKYFEDRNPIGQILKLMAGVPCTVTGVYKNLPENRSIRPDYLVSFTTLYETLQPNIETIWDWCMSSTYLLLDANVDPKVFGQKIERLLDEYTENETNSLLTLWPYSKVHLHFNETNDNRGMFLLMGLIALFVLAIAGINFSNLSTAYSSTRIREIALRKISGAHRIHIIRQFLGESLLVALSSLIIALALAEFFVPMLNRLMAENLELLKKENLDFLFIILLITILLGVLSGSYPAFYLSSLNPDVAIRRTWKTSSGSSFFSKCLIVFQFIISIALIVCTILVYSQLSYMRGIELGFDKENILIGYLQLTGENNMSRYNTMRSDLLSNPQIMNVTWAHNAPFFSAEWWRIGAEGHDPDDRFRLQHNHVEYDFLETFKIKIAEGRDFSREHPSDTTGVALISKGTARMLGWENDALGKTIYNEDDKYKVIGVMEDFHMFSVARPTDPQFFSYTTRELSWPNSHIIRISPNQDLAKMKKLVTLKYQEYFPADNIEFNVLDENMDQRNFGLVLMIGRLFGIFSILAIFIAAIGLYGMVSFVTRQKTKEIGIRKANGAMTVQLFMFISKEFFILLLIANALAIPIAYYACSFILGQFANKVNIALVYFAIASLLSLLITFITIGIQVFKASNANPVESLRFE